MESLEHCYDHILQTLVNNDGIVICYENWEETPDYIKLLSPLEVRMAYFIELLDLLQKREYLYYYIVEKLFPDSPSDFYKEHGSHPAVIALTVQGNFFIKGGGFCKGNKKNALKAKHNVSLSLGDIWQGTPKQYEQVIAGLKKQYDPISMPFVEDTNAGMLWNKFPKRGFVQYIKGFLCTCIQKGWVGKSKCSARQWKEIIQNTFNININPEPFKNMLTPPEKTYMMPFKNMPTNESSQNS